LIRAQTGKAVKTGLMASFGTIEGPIHLCAVFGLCAMYDLRNSSMALSFRRDGGCRFARSRAQR
jgi:hypothetical protein